MQGLNAYPSAQLHEAEQDLLFAEFHDILPGTTIQECEADSIGVLQHGLTTVSRLQMKGAMALLAGQPKAVPEQTPVFLYNPHPYPITGDFVFELMPADQNWSQVLRNAVTVTQNGTQIPSQEEKPAVNMNLDWRKRVAVHATLEPSGLTRLDCAFTQVPCEAQENVTFPKEDIRFDNGEMQLTINVRTGLVDHYIAAGVEYVSNGAFAPVLYQDSPDPWYMGKTASRRSSVCLPLQRPDVPIATQMGRKFLSPLSVLLKTELSVCWSRQNSSGAAPGWCRHTACPKPAHRLRSCRIFSGMRQTRC